jgi:nucleoside-diphosphate-sugar epimerase
VSWHHVDLLDPEQVAALVAEVQPSHLLHLAWYTAPGKYWTSPANIDWIQASLALLKAFVEHGGQRVVVAGTCAEYAWQYGYCSEHLTPLVPATLYGACKHALQLALAAYSRQAGFSSAWGRLFFLYGPYEPPTRLVSSVISALLLGQPARCSHGGQVRDFLYVADAANALVTLLGSAVEGAVNIGSGLPVTLRALVSSIAERLGGQHVIEFGAVPVPADEPHLLVADVNRLTSEVGWRPQYSLQAGLDETIAAWRARLPTVTERVEGT